MKILAVIPARSGSKGLKDKNIKPLKNKPLIFYSIEAAKVANCFDEIMVSTDSKKYAEIAKKYGASVPFLRSKEMSSDKAKSWDAVREVLTNYKKVGKDFEYVMLLQPTSPLRTSRSIIESINLIKEKNATSVISVTECEHSPLWSNTLPKDNCLKNFVNKEYDDLPRQLLPQYYRFNGAIYLVSVKNIFSNKIIDKNSFAYIMPKNESVDIDDIFDFKLAELYLKEKDN